MYGFADILSSYPDRHLLSPSQLIMTALDSTPPLNATHFKLYGGNVSNTSLIQLLTTPVRMNDENAFAFKLIRQIQEPFSAGWSLPIVLSDNFDKEESLNDVLKGSVFKKDILNPCTLQFRSSSLERSYEENGLGLFSLSLIACLAVHVVSTIFHCLVLPNTVLFLTMTLFTFTTFLTPLFLLVCSKLRLVSTQLQRSPNLRLGLTLICLISAYLTTQFNVVCLFILFLIVLIFTNV